MPRRSELRRRDAGGGVHLVAANLDVLGIVVAINSPVGFIDRAIVAARVAQLQPFVVVNKCDLDDTAALLRGMDEGLQGNAVASVQASSAGRSGIPGV